MSYNEISKPIDILLVEDNPGDVFLITNSLSTSQMPNTLYHVTDGIEAMAFLRQENSYATVVRPHLILLDLNLPNKNGFEVLQEIKADPDLKHLPVVVLTSSRAEQDVLKSYRLYASCYISKPFEVNEFDKAVKSIESFWLQRVQLPHQ